MKKILATLLIMISTTTFAEPVTFHTGQVFHGIDRVGLPCKMEVIKELECKAKRCYRVEVSGRSCLAGGGMMKEICDYRNYKTQRDIEPTLYYGKVTTWVPSDHDFSGHKLNWQGYPTKEIELAFDTEVSMIEYLGDINENHPYYFVNLGFKVFSDKYTFGDCSYLEEQ